VQEEAMYFKSIEDLTRGELQGLLEDAALNWLAIDGLWFQAIEKKSGPEKPPVVRKAPSALILKLRPKGSFVGSTSPRRASRH
jgi:hypothetical protein